MNTAVTKRKKPSFYHIVGVPLENSPNMFLTHFYLVHLLGLASKRQSISDVSRSKLSRHPHEKLFYFLLCAQAGFIPFFTRLPIFSGKDNNFSYE